MDTTTVICVICGLAFGTLVGFITSRISVKFAKNPQVSKAMIGNLIRIIIDAGALAAGYFVCKALNLSLLAVLLPIALGLSIFGMLFLKLSMNRLLKEQQSQTAIDEADK